MHGEPSRPVEPDLLSGARERGQERVAVAGRAVADARALVERLRARTPGELGAGEQELLVEVGSRGGHDPGCSGAPLDTDLAVVGNERAPLPGGPVREPVLDHGGSREQGARLTLELLAPLACEQVAASQERRDVAHDAVRRVQAAMRLGAVEPLRPQPVGVAPGPDRVCALAPGVGPARVARPVEHRARGEHRAGCAPHQLVGGIVDVLAHAGV